MCNVQCLELGNNVHLETDRNVSVIGCLTELLDNTVSYQ